jgi:hypothetical protein
MRNIQPHEAGEWSAPVNVDIKHWLVLNTTRRIMVTPGRVSSSLA